MDFLSDPAWITTAATALASVCAAITGFVMALRNARKTAQIERILENAQERQTYTICPHCKKKVRLAELSWHLPDGSLDQNLNGVADKDEI